jgi:hypothetical protein
MDNCIEAQWELYIEYMRETLDYTYNNTLDYYTLDTYPLQMQRECNDVAFEEFTKHTTKMKLIHPKFKINDVVESCNS